MSQVHLLLGYNGGVMANLAASPNDPLFLNHHTMIDCIFEKWLKRHSTAQYPENNSEDFIGHRVNDCIVPFFPVYTHMDMFRGADTFGYACDLPNISEESSPVPTNPPIPTTQYVPTNEPDNDADNDNDDDNAALSNTIYSTTIILVIILAVSLLI